MNGRNSSNLYLKAIGLRDCIICSSVFDQSHLKPETYQHVMTTSVIGKAMVMLISCPYLLKLDMAAKNLFLEKYKICRVCMISTIRADHKESSCRFGRRYKVKCRASTCNYNYLICSLHKHLQKGRISARKKALEKVGVICHF